MSHITNKDELYTPAGSALDAFRGDYLGFTFNGIHSTDLGIVRVSSGNRYDDNLLPTMSDRTAQIPGADGTYYFGSHYTQRSFTLNIAFDHLLDYQLRNLRVLFGDKKPHKLIFDEFPYKVYTAKVTGAPNLKHLAFDYEGGRRIYKGEGTINFTCYYPYAKSRYIYLEDYATPVYDSDQQIIDWIPNYTNIPEWHNDKTFFNLPEWILGSGIQSGENTSHGHLYADLAEDLTQASPEESFQIENDPMATGDDAQRVAGTIYTDELSPEPEDSVPGYIIVNPNDGVEVGESDGFIALSDSVLETFYDHVAYEYSFDWSSFIVVHNEFAHLRDNGEGTYIVTYNPGDVATDWQLVLNPTEFSSGETRVASPDIVEGGIIGIYSTGQAILFQSFQLNEGDSYVVFDSRSNTIEGYDWEHNKTGNVYNAAIVAGAFFKIPVGTDQFFIAGAGVDGETTTADWEAMGNSLTYDYLYF